MNSKLHDICMCCNSHNVIEYYRKSFFNLPILKCNNCLSHFIRFDKKINLENYYNEEYWETFRKNHDGNIENKKIILLKIKHRVLQRTFRILLNLVKMTGVNQSRPFSQYAFFKPYLRGHRLFDLGAGEGTGLKFFEKNGFIVSGLEPSIKI